MADGEAKAIYGPLDEDLEAEIERLQRACSNYELRLMAREDEIERLKRAADYQNKYIEELETVRALSNVARDEMARLRTALRQIADTDMPTALAYRIIAKEALGDD